LHIDRRDRDLDEVLIAVVVVGAALLLLALAAEPAKEPAAAFALFAFAALEPACNLHGLVACLFPVGQVLLLPSLAWRGSRARRRGLGRGRC
jgi:hypothetical protein